MSMCADSNQIVASRTLDTKVAAQGFYINHRSHHKHCGIVRFHLQFSLELSHLSA